MGSLDGEFINKGLKVLSPKLLWMTLSISGSVVREGGSDTHSKHLVRTRVYNLNCLQWVSFQPLQEVNQCCSYRRNFISHSCQEQLWRPYQSSPAKSGIPSAPRLPPAHFIQLHIHFRLCGYDWLSHFLSWCSGQEVWLREISANREYINPKCSNTFLFNETEAEGLCHFETYSVYFTYVEVGWSLLYTRSVVNKPWVIWIKHKCHLHK